MGSYELKKIQNLIWEVSECKYSVKLNSRYLLHSQKDKDKELEMILSRIDFDYHKNFIIIGIKNIVLLNEIYKRKTHASTITIIEICDSSEDKILLDCNKEDLTFLTDINTVNLAIGTRDELVKQLDSVLCGGLKQYNLRNTEIISLPYIKSQYPNEVESITKIILERLTTSIMSYGNSVEDILLGMDNFMDNWGNLFRGMDFYRFKDSYINKLAVLVGAGPSLDKNIRQLKKLKGKALIMCVDAALDALLNEGIIPDLVASIERTEVTTKFYQRGNIPREIVFVGPNVIKEAVFENFDRMIFTGRSGDALIRDFSSYIGFNNLEIGGNVSNILVSFAEHLGCNPISFVGLDLAYTGGRTHIATVADSVGEKSMAAYKKKDNIVYVKGQNGDMLETYEFFMYAKNWIESNISRNSKHLFINATEGGAQIEGTVNKTLNEVIEQYGFDTIEPISAIYDKLDSDKEINKTETTKKALHYIKELGKYFKEISIRADEFNNQLKTHQKSGLVTQMEKLRGQMEDYLIQNPAGRFIMQSIIISYNRDIHSFPMYLTRDDEQKMLKRSLDFYETIAMVSSRVSLDLRAYRKVLISYLIKYGKQEGGR